MELHELPYKDLRALIEELECEDDKLYKEVSALALELENNSTLDFVDNSEDETEDVSDVITKLESVNDIGINKRLRNKALNERKAKYRIRIQRLAINQSLLKLSDTIPDYDLQALTTVLTEKQAAIATKAADSANMRLKRLLNSLIPVNIRRLYNMYPWVIRRCPGFTYSTSLMDIRHGHYYGEQVSFWATPDIPYFFKQGTEVNILLAYRSELLYLVNNAVSTYYKYQNMQENRALGVATRIIKHGVRTYFDLLMYNPSWFEIIYNLAKNVDADKSVGEHSGTI